MPNKGKSVFLQYFRLAFIIPPLVIGTTSEVNISVCESHLCGE
jgi:hypothetical protein